MMNQNFGGLFDLEYGSPLPDQIRSGDRFPVFGSNGQVGRHDDYLIDGPGIIVGRKGSVGKVCWSDDPFWPIDTAYYVVPKHESNLRWLYWSLLNTDLKKLDSATGVPGLNRHDVYSVQTNAPHPEEQSRIAAVLDTVDALIDSSEAVLAKLRQVRAGLLHDLLTRGLNADGQLRDPDAHPDQFKDSPLGRIPGEWEIDSLVSRISFPQGQVDPRYEPYCDFTLVAPDHIESETGRLLERATAAAQGAISGKYLFAAGDVLYSKIRPYLRKAVLADGTGLCSADMYPLRPQPGTNPQFLLAVMLGESFSRFASAVSMRSGFPKINRQEMAEYQLAWPLPDEQNRIADVIESHDDLITAEQSELTKLRHLKSGLMTDLLEGRVRVPEDLPSQP